MNDKGKLMKQAAITIQRLYDLLYGEGEQCVHCGQEVSQLFMNGRCIYARVENLQKCTESPKMPDDGKRYWCRQFQGKIPPESKFFKAVDEDS